MPPNDECPDDGRVEALEEEVKDLWEVVEDLEERIDNAATNDELNRAKEAIAWKLVPWITALVLGILALLVAIALAVALISGSTITISR